MAGGLQPWVAGVTEILVGPDDQTLGTAERYPRFSVRSGFVPYFNDVGGPVIPTDMLWAGKEVFIFADLNRWDEEVLEYIRSITANSDALSWGADDVGSLMLHENLSIPVTLSFPYASKAAYAGMPNGYKFYNCWYEGPEEFSVLGTNPQKVHVVFHGIPAQNDDGDWQLGVEL